jgi:CubicO group peptidase (beta-lactamase class C family)
MNHTRISLSAIVAGFLAIANVRAAEDSAQNRLPRATPESAHVDSAQLLKYVEALDAQVEGMNSVMVVRSGKVIAEGWWAPYDAESQHTMYSLSKSFTSTAIGIAQAEGKLSIDDTVVSSFPDLVPANASPNLKAMRVRDLLAMSSGHHAEEIAKFDYESEDAVKNFLALPVAHKPGTHFMYNTPGSFVLSAIVQKATGQSTVDYLQSRLFGPLGIEHPVWDAGRSGINLGGFGLHIRTEDIAKFGLLYLRGGDWNGKRLVTKEWVHAATSRQTSNGSNPKSDWDQGYGYQFWRCRNGGYRGDGAFGQYCIVLPDKDTVVAITSGVRDMQKVLDVTWDYLLPALGTSATEKNEDALRKLKEKLANLKMRTIDGEASSPIIQEIAGKKFKFGENSENVETISLERGDGHATVLNARVNGKNYRIQCAPGKWSSREKLAWAGISSLEKTRDEMASSTGAWNGNVLTAKIAFTETPYVLTLRCDFSKEQVTIDPEFNVSFGPAKRPQLIGRLQ